ncbi:MAG: hypothetical protein BIFFINMI_03151 [Phycisphaerae bacterium]|nr:hypothetical protein [Phycisphaerae bacterium]
MGMGVAAAWLAFAPAASAQPQADPNPTHMTGSIPGTLLVMVQQGTKGAPAIAGGQVAVDLVHGRQSHWHKTAELREDGRVLLEQIPITLPIQPQVTFAYKGIDYTLVGKAMTPGAPDGVVRITVFEPTETEPAWVVKMHHIIITPTPDGQAYRVEESLVVENPDDHTWIGRPDGHGGHVTMRRALPENLDNKPEFVSDQPLLGGTSNFKLGYVIPVRDRKAALRVPMVAPTRQVEVMVTADEGTQVEAVDLTPDPSMNQMTGRECYKATDLATGQTVGVSLALPAAKAVATAAGGSPLRKMLALIGGAIVLLGLGMFWFRKKEKKA